VGNQGINLGLRPQSPRHPKVVHRCPPAIHRLSTRFVPRPVDSVGTRPARRPQSLQQEIHTRPQSMDNFVTLRVCPHRFPQDLSTSVGRAPAGCPPLGITSCERLCISVDNVGTKPSRPTVDKDPVWMSLRRGIHPPSARSRWTSHLWTTLPRCTQGLCTACG
jgi:hypothetical protein